MSATVASMLRWTRYSLPAAWGMAFGVGLAGCASPGAQIERWHMVESRAPAQAESLPGSTRQPVRAVFFREAGAGPRAQEPVNVYINGQYQASLVGNAYTAQSLCPGEHRLAAHFGEVQQRYAGKQKTQSFVLGTAPVQYFRVVEGKDGGAQVLSLPEGVAGGAAPALGSLQAHTLPRVVRNGCTAG